MRLRSSSSSSSSSSAAWRQLMGFRVRSFAAPDGPLPCDRVRVRLSPAFSRQPHEDAARERLVDAAWRAQLAEYPRLFNGTKFRLSDWRVVADTLELDWGLTDYKTYLGTCCAPAFAGAPSAVLSRKVGVAAVLETADARVALIKRSPTVGVYPNLFDTPGGHPEPDHIGLTPETLLALETHGREDEKRAMESAAAREFFASIVSEVHEEINVPEADLSPPLLLGVVQQTEALTPSFSFLLRTARSAEEVMAMYRAGPKDRFESTSLELIDKAQLLADDSSAFLDRLTPSARGSLELWRAFVASSSA